MKIPFFKQNKKKIFLGGKYLDLNIEDRHEELYFNSIQNNERSIDRLIAERYIRKGDKVLDAGANIGFSSLLFLENGASKVFAFEPVPYLYKRLRKLAGPDLKTFKMALSDASGGAEMLISSSHNQGSTLNPLWEKVFPTVYGEERNICVVEKAKLDDLLPDTMFDFIKLDIEGSEFDFLRGSTRLLLNSPPRILQVEIYPEVFDSVYSELKKYFKFIKRAVLNNKTSSMELIDIGDRDSLSYDFIQGNPPTYLCSNHYLLLSDCHSWEGSWQNGYFVYRDFANLEFGGACLQKLLDEYEFRTVLDIGSGAGEHSDFFEQYNKKVCQIDFGKSRYFNKRSASREVIVGDYLHSHLSRKFDLVWACHVLEHQPNVKMFLRKIHRDLKAGGILAITVPPRKDEVVGGHLSIWNAGLLLYNLIIAGFDCRKAKVLKYGYNISVILEKEEIEIPELHYDYGDIDRLKEYFPDGLSESFNGDISVLNW